MRPHTFEELNASGNRFRPCQRLHSSSLRRTRARKRKGRSAALSFEASPHSVTGPLQAEQPNELHART